MKAPRAWPGMARVTPSESKKRSATCSWTSRARFVEATKSSEPAPAASAPNAGRAKDVARRQKHRTPNIQHRTPNAERVGHDRPLPDEFFVMRSERLRARCVERKGRSGVWSLVQLCRSRSG